MSLVLLKSCVTVAFLSIWNQEYYLHLRTMWHWRRDGCGWRYGKKTVVLFLDIIIERLDGYLVKVSEIVISVNG